MEIEQVRIDFEEKDISILITRKDDDRSANLKRKKAEKNTGLYSGQVCLVLLETRKGLTGCK